MRLNRKKAVRFFCSALAALLICPLGLVASATGSKTYDVPYQSYYFSESTNGRKVVADRAVFDVSDVIDGNSLGITSFSGITDICNGKDGKLYVLDSQNKRIVVINEAYDLERIIDTFTFNGVTETLNEPQGIFVSEDGSIVIADTENMRILYCNSNGEITNIITEPKGELIPENFQFYPIKCVIDQKGFTYILSRGSYYGALTYDENGEFCGFYGSNPVITNPIEQISRIFNRIFTNNEGAAYKAQKLPFQFEDLCVGSDDFIYTVSPNTQSQAGQIRKLSPSGDNILISNGVTGAVSAETVTFGEEEMYTDNTDHVTTQNFSGITVDDDGYIYAMDSAYGKIYVYDGECNSITVIGCGLGIGEHKGSFATPSAMECFNNQLLVADSKKNTITVFSLTDYGKLIYKADTLSQEGEYEQAGEYWQQALEMSSSFQLTYRGLAQAEYMKGNYEEAIRYSKLAEDQVLYASAFKEISNKFIANNLWWIIILIVVFVGLIIALIIITKKRKLVIIKNDKLKTFLSSIIHPFKSFYDLKYLNRGSVLLSAVTIALFYLLTVSETLFGGFMYTIVDSESFNALLILGGTVGLALLFAIVNWAVCSLFEGKGRLKDVLYVTASALLPQLINSVFYIIASHFIASTSSGIISTVNVVCLIWSALILIIGLICIHDFSFFKTVLTGLLTVIGMVLVVAVMFMILTFFQNFVSFIASLVREVAVR